MEGRVRFRQLPNELRESRHGGGIRSRGLKVAAGKGYDRRRRYDGWMVLYAKEIVETEFLTMPPQRLVLEAAKAMATRRHGFAIVMSPEGTPIGIVTEWDILGRRAGWNPSDVRLQDIMTPNLVSVDANEGIDRVAKLMAQDGTRGCSSRRTGSSWE